MRAAGVRTWACAAVAAVVLALAGAAAAQPAGPRDVTSEFPWRPDAIESGLARGQALARGEGDVLVVAYHGTADAVVLCCDLRMPLHRIPDRDVRVLAAYVPGLARADLDLELHLRAGATSWILPVPDDAWRDATAPASGLTNVRTVELASAALGAPREVSVYAPPARPGRAVHHVVYVPDGAALERLAPAFEATIARGCVAPFYVVGAHARTGRARAEEYVPGLDPAAFEAHARFFAEELPAWAERDLGVTSDPARRVLLGMSNGADLVLELSRRHGDRYGAVIAFSAGADVDPAAWGAEAPGPRYYLASGALEPAYRLATARAAELLRDLEADVTVRERVGAHGLPLWAAELPAALTWAFVGDDDLTSACDRLGAPLPEPR